MSAGREVGETSGYRRRQRTDASGPRDQPLDTGGDWAGTGARLKHLKLVQHGPLACTDQISFIVILFNKLGLGCGHFREVYQ